jgi:hypothetical protein
MLQAGFHFGIGIWHCQTTQKQCQKYAFSSGLIVASHLINVLNKAAGNLITASIDQGNGVVPAEVHEKRKTLGG